MRDTLAGLTKPSEGLLNGLNFRVSDVLGDFEIEMRDTLAGLTKPSEGLLNGLNFRVSDVLGDFEIEMRDTLAGLAKPSEGLLNGLNFGVSDVLGDFEIEMRDTLAGLTKPSEGLLNGLNFRVSDVLGDFEIEMRDTLAGLTKPSEGLLNGLNFRVSDVLGDFEIEMRDTLAGLTKPSEGLLNGLNFGVSDVLGDFEIEMRDTLAGLVTPSLSAMLKPVREYSTRHGAAKPFQEPDSAPDTYQCRNLLDWFDNQITNSGLVSCTRQLFADGHYSMAVLKAFLYVENLVQDLSGLPDKDGADLMKTVFSVKDPVVRLNAFRNKSDRSQQLGYMEIFAGAMTGIRNPRAHEHDWYDDPDEALELLVFANHLIRMISRADRSLASG